MTDQNTASSNALFVRAAKNADIANLFELLEQGLDVYATDEQGFTAAHLLAIQGQKDALLHMGGRFPNLLTTCDNQGITPAMYFALAGDGVGMVPLARLNPHALEQQDKYGATIAMILAKKEMGDVLVQLVKLCPSILWQTHDGKETIASWLARLEDGGMIAVFDDDRDYKIELCLQAEADGTTPLDYLLAGDLENAVLTMVDINPEALKRTDHFGATLPMYMAFTPHFEAVKTLVTKRPEVLTQADNDGTTLAMCYAMQGKDAEVRALGSINFSVLSQKDKHGNSVLRLLKRYDICRARSAT